MGKNLSILIFCIYFLFTLQLVRADDIPIPTEPLIGKKKNAKDSKLLGHLLELQVEWSTYQKRQTRQVFRPSDPLLNIDNGFVVVEAVAVTDVSALETKLRALGMRKISVFGRLISGQFPINALDSAGLLQELLFMRPAFAINNVGNTTSTLSILY